jgi:hypothetical protein
MGGSVGFFLGLKIDSFMGLVDVGDGEGGRGKRGGVATPNFEVGDLRFRGIEDSRKGSVGENTDMPENNGFGLSRVKSDGFTGTLGSRSGYLGLKSDSTKFPTQAMTLRSGEDSQGLSVSKNPNMGLFAAYQVEDGQI